MHSNGHGICRCALSLGGEGGSMARCTVYDNTPFDELFKLDFNEIAEEALKEAAPILENSMKAAVRQAVEHEGDSELVESIKANKPKKTRNGAWIVTVTPKGYSKYKVYHAKKKGRKHKVSNALKAIWKEYGIAGRQPPRPFLTKATNDAKDAVFDAIQKTFDSKAEIN